jgi:cell fate (sporulation/competence/biofilm development) regulator YmcA (YheA/YmcA/DUF963 family)
MGEHAHDHNACSIKKYDSRDLVVREDIMNKAKELAALISTSDEVHIFKHAETLVDQNERVQTLISAIKKKQKEVVAFETTFKNSDMVQKIESEMQELQDELDGIPIVQQFQQTQHDINYLLQLVISIVKESLSEKINVEAGTSAPPTSCD